jgi:uncharacterized membrane protein
MKAWLFLAGTLLLTACGRKETMGDLSPNDTPAVATAIVERPAVRRISVTPVGRDADRSSPSPVDTTPLSSETRYRALGTEPFWAVTVKGSTATLERPDKRPAHYAITRADDGRTVRYLGDGFSMIVTDGPCNDGMSDAHWADRVAVSFGEGTLKGCGGVREDF